MNKCVILAAYAVFALLVGIGTSSTHRAGQLEESLSVKVAESKFDVAGNLELRVVVKNNTTFTACFYRELVYLYVHYRELLGEENDAKTRGQRLLAVLKPLPPDIVLKSIEAIQPGATFSKALTVEPREGYELDSVTLRLCYGQAPSDFLLENRRQRLSTIPTAVLWQRKDQ